jgi:WD40 repeat protein
LARIPAASTYPGVVSKDGRFLATREFTTDDLPGETKLWDVTNLDSIRLVAEHDFGNADVVDVAAAGRLLAVISVPGDYFGEGSIWDIADPAKPRQLSKLPLDDVSDMAFSADGTTLVTSTRTGDGRLVFWSLDRPTAPRRIAALEDQTGLIDGIAWSSDGRLLATTGIEDTVRLRKIVNAEATTKEQVAEACRMAGGGLTPERWATYVPGLPYRQTCPG